MMDKSDLLKTNKTKKLFCCWPNVTVLHFPFLDNIYVKKHTTPFSITLCRRQNKSLTSKAEKLESGNSMVLLNHSPCQIPKSPFPVFLQYLKQQQVLQAGGGRTQRQTTIAMCGRKGQILWGSASNFILWPWVSPQISLCLSFLIWICN